MCLKSETFPVVETRTIFRYIYPIALLYIFNNFVIIHLFDIALNRTKTTSWVILGATSAVLRTYYWICAQKLYLVVLRGKHTVPEIKHRTFV